MIRRIFLCLGALCLGVALLLASVPLWLGAGLRFVGESRGLHFATYERVGYGRFALRKVVFVRKTTEVKADRIELDTPLWWQLQRLRGRPRAVTVEKWEVNVTRDPHPQLNESPQLGWNELQALLRNFADNLHHWLPHAEIGVGKVTWPSGGLSLNSAVWDKRQLAVRELTFLERRSNVTIALPTIGSIGIHADVMEEKLQLEAVWSPEGLDGTLKYQDQPATISAHFSPHDWTPRRAALRSESWRFPGAKFGLGSVYGEIAGKVAFEWQETAFALDLTAAGTPQDKNVPALQAVARARGDLEQVSVEKLELNAAGFHASLSDPVVIDRAGKLRSNPSHFFLEADLARLSKDRAKGKAKGELTAAAAAEGKAKLDFQLTVTEAQLQGLAVASVELAGGLLGQKLTIGKLHVDLGAGNEINANGAGDLAAHTLERTDVSGRFERAFLTPWIQALPEFSSVIFRGEVSGSTDRLAHKGHAEIAQVKTPKTRLTTLRTDWSGEGKAVSNFKLRAESTHGRWEFEGMGDAVKVTLSQIQLFHENQLAFASSQPCTFSLTPPMTLSGFRIEGPAGMLGADGRSGIDGHVHLEGKDVRSEWLNDFVDLPIDDGVIRNVAINGQWKEGPMTFSTELEVEVPLTNEQSVRLSLAANGSENGVQVEHLRIGEPAAVALTAQGHLPFTIHPTERSVFRFDPNGAVQAQATTEPNGPLWAMLATVTGVQLIDPHVSFDLSGSLNRPIGKLQMLVPHVRPDPQRWPKIPEVTELKTLISADRAALAVEELTLNIDGQSIRLSGKLPAEDSFWKMVIDDPRSVDWRKAEAQMDIPDTDLAALSRRFPGYLAPKGHASATVKLVKGGRLEGNLRIREASSRPLGSLGVLQDIYADLEFTGKKASLKEVTARIGGQPVALTGTIEIGPNGMPRLNVAGRGQNVSLVRQAGLLIRTDFDLKLITDDQGDTRVSGQVKLRDSLFLADIRALIPSGERSVAQRPPYFSVDTPPLNHWELGIDVMGDRFMRLRTTVFNGVASARFHLDGTLGEPRAIGEVTINEGQVLFPFAAFSVDRGSVRLSQDNPFEPLLSVNGSARRYDFDVQMEITGTASDPKLTFSSNPPLESEQLLLMVMAGQVPRTDFSKTNQQKLTAIGTYLGQSLFENFGGDSGSGDRLAFTSGERISTQGKETYTIEYRLNERFSLVGEYDEYDDYNAGLKWRVLRGQGKGEK